jgi:hypothetical protein
MGGCLVKKKASGKIGGVLKWKKVRFGMEMR